MKICIITTESFPNGLAATQRIKLLSKALVQGGAKVEIYITSAYEKPPYENDVAKGEFEGVNFEYTPGTTKRANNFLIRRYLDVKGIIGLIINIFRLAKSDDSVCIYSYLTIQRITIQALLVRFLCFALRMPVVLELNERPWSLKKDTNLFEKLISPLFLSTGVLAISQFLFDWANTEAKTLKREISIKKVPILVNVEEQQHLMEHYPKNNLLFAGSIAYDATIDFIIKAMNYVWEEKPNVTLQISGSKDTDPAIHNLRRKTIRHEKIVLLGYLSREQLLINMNNAYALLIPLFDDVKSKARFPTKIGEYLLSGRPIVTSNVGEIKQYFTVNNAYICQKNDPREYARLIINALNNFQQAKQIGFAGRQLALEHFDYKNWGKPLYDYFYDLCNHN